VYIEIYWYLKLPVARQPFNSILRLKLQLCSVVQYSVQLGYKGRVLDVYLYLEFYLIIVKWGGLHLWPWCRIVPYPMEINPRVLVYCSLWDPGFFSSSPMDSRVFPFGFWIIVSSTVFTWSWHCDFGSWSALLLVCSFFILISPQFSLTQTLMDLVFCLPFILFIEQFWGWFY
jgi:hypothetical protein